MFQQIILKPIYLKQTLFLFLEQLKRLLVKAPDKHLCFGLNHLVSPKYFSIGTFLSTSLAACLLYVTVCARQSNDNDSAHTYVFLVDDNKIFKIEKLKKIN